MLLSTRQSIKEIAHATGWFDAAHFCRQFRHATGFSPKEYRLQTHT
jgi:AraC-like DNA-binding protein